jgi:hypothetical protein
MHQPAVRNTDKNQNVGNAVGQIVQYFTTSARPACSERNQAVKHVEPEPQKTKKRRDNEQPISFDRFPKADCSDYRRYE